MWLFYNTWPSSQQHFAFFAVHLDMSLDILEGQHPHFLSFRDDRDLEVLAALLDNLEQSLKKSEPFLILSMLKYIFP